MQTIEALKHLKNKMGKGRNKISLTDYDRQSLNRLIEHYNESMQQTHDSQIMFKKLFINEFLRQSVLYDKGTRLALSNIEDMLTKPLDEYYEVFAKESRWKKFFKTVKEIEYVEEHEMDESPLKRSVQEQHNKKLIESNHDKLLETVLKGYLPEQAKSFLENHLHELILTYRNYK